MAFISDSRGGLWKRLSFVVNGLTTVDTDIFPIDELTSVEYAITFSNEALGVFKSLYLRASKKNNQVVDSVFAKIGDSINVRLNSKIELSNFVLEVSNYENYALDITISKLKH